MSDTTNEIVDKNVVQEKPKYPKDEKLQVYADLLKYLSHGKSGVLSKEERAATEQKFIAVKDDENVQRITRLLYDHTYVTNITTNSGTRRPDGFRESGREHTMPEDEYIYDIFELIEKIHSGTVSEIDRYLLIKRYLSANYDNSYQFCWIISKKAYAGLKIDFIKKYVPGINEINFRRKYDLTQEIVENFDFSNYFMIENPGACQMFSSATHAYLVFNSYGEINVYLESTGKMCMSVWNVVNDVAFSFKNNRIRNMVIEGTLFRSTTKGWEVKTVYGRYFGKERQMPGDIRFSMYDMYTIEEFFSGKCDRLYEERYSELCKKMSEAYKPKKSFRVAKCFKVSSNQDMLSKMCSEHSCDGYIIMSPNKMDHTKMQEFTARVGCDKITIENVDTDGNIKVLGDKKPYTSMLLGLSDTVAGILKENPEYLINKDVDIAHLGKRKGRYTMPMIMIDQK